MPVVAAMLILLLAGVALAELFGAQRMQSVLAVESSQAFWIAEAGLWHAAHEDTDLSTPVAFASGTYTVTKSGDDYTSTGVRHNATREASFTFAASGGGGGVSASPIAHWKLDETSGIAAVDSVAANDGTLAGGVTLGLTGAPAADTSMGFDGSSDYIDIPHSSSYMLANGTIQFWFNADNTSGDQAIFSKDSSGFDTGGHVNIKLVGDDVEVRFQSTTTSYTVTASNVVTSGTWHHVAFTFGDDGMALYFDGALRDIDSYTGGMGSTSGGSGNEEPLAVGASSWGSGNLVITPLTHYYDGRIDAVAIYGVALSAADVATLYSGGGAI
jgi:hypothetical protein